MIRSGPAAPALGRLRALGLAVLSFVVVSTVAGPAPGHAQSLTGVVQEAGSGTPVAGALVRMIDAEGQGLRSFLTPADGRYRIQGTGVGLYTVLVERIGYETARFGPFELAAGETVPRNLVVTQRPIELEGLEVEGSSRRCDLRDEGTGATQVIWSQVRQALEASTWTRREGNLGFRLRAWERRLTPGDLTILDEAHRSYRSRAGNSVRSLPAEELARGGYVRSADDGSVVYYAPDAEALLSDTFLGEHCFSVRAGDGAEEGWVGLEFEPVLDRDTADVAGVVWIERRSARLRRLDFRFVGLTYEVGEEHATGQVRYTQLPDGRWIVEDWRIRAPAVVVRRSNSSMGRRDRQMVEAVYETGAEVLSVQGEGFDWAADRPTVTVRGTVWDSLAAAPLAGATVRVAGRGWRSDSDGAGRFELTEVPPGRYRVLFHHPRLDSLGLAPRGVDVALEAGDAPELALGIPSRATLLAESCPAGLGGSAVVGWVRAADGSTAVAGTTVQALAEDGTSVSETTSGVDGSYRLCGLEAGRALAMEARVGPVRSETVPIRTRAGTHARADLTVSWAAAAAAERTTGLQVTGLVRDASNGRPVGAATVELVDEAGNRFGQTAADASGRFMLTVDEERPLRLRFTSLGYAPAESETLPARNRRHRVEVELAPEALDVEGVVVTVEGRRPALERVGFYERMERTSGRLLDREELGMESARRASDALLRVPGVQWFDASTRSGNTTRQYVQFRAASRAVPQGDPCLPAIYVDGGLVRWGKTLGAGGLESYPTLDELVGGADIEALELYDSPSSLPPRFMGPGTLCGAIVVWTRR